MLNTNKKQNQSNLIGTPQTPADAGAKRFSQKGVGCLRFLNAVEPGTEVPIHRHPTKEETFVILRGKVKVTAHNDDGFIIESVVLCAEEGRYGVNIPKGVWHALESLESSSCIFECKEGPFVEHEEEGVLCLQP